MKPLRIQHPRSRLDTVLTAKFTDFTRSSLKKLIEEGFVEVNGKVVTKPAERIDPASKVELNYKEDSSKLDLDIIYQDDDCLVINKPAGILSHSKGALLTEATVASWAKDYYTGLDEARSGVVHRLDRDTSGIMIIAKTPEAKTSLMKEFSLKRVLKTYQALVDGIPEHKTFKIIQPIARNPKKPTIFKISHKGKPAETLIEVLSSDSTKNQSLLQLQPKTGRTHQLRVHLSANGWPIVGDRFYNPNFQDGQKLQLKAVQLTIQLPSKEWKTFKLEDLESK